MLTKAILDTKTVEILVEDGAAMERLQKNRDFQRYQALVTQTMAQLLLRLQRARLEELPLLQGALIQHRLLLDLPEKVVAAAARAVNIARENVDA